MGRRKQWTSLVAALLTLALPAAAAHAAPFIAGGAPGNFTGTLTGSDQKLYTTLAAYVVGDLSGTGSGWHVTVQATQFACTSADIGCPGTGDSLPANSLLMGPPTVACTFGSCTGTAAPPKITMVGNAAIDGGAAITIASAALNTGGGIYTFTPGTIGSGNLQLTVPSYAYATTYHSTLTISAVTGP